MNPAHYPPFAWERLPGLYGPPAQPSRPVPGMRPLVGHAFYRALSYGPGVPAGQTMRMFGARHEYAPAAWEQRAIRRFRRWERAR